MIVVVLVEVVDGIAKEPELFDSISEAESRRDELDSENPNSTVTVYEKQLEVD